MAYDDALATNSAEPANDLAQVGDVSDLDRDGIIKQLLTDAATYVDTELSPDRARASRFYKGEKFGNEVDGRSQVVTTDVRDTIIGILPSLARVFFGAERPLEFQPRNPEGAEAAEQATDYVRWVFEREGGFLKTYEVWKDALVRRLGIFRWCWVTEDEAKSYHMAGLTMEQVELLSAEPGVKLTGVTPEPPAPQSPPQDPNEPAPPPPEPTYTVDVVHTVPKGCVRIWSIPPEEFLIDRNARDLESARVVGHRTEKTHSDLRALGVPQAVLDEYGTEDGSLASNEEAIERQNSISTGQLGGPFAGEGNKTTSYVEAFLYLPTEKDPGVTELRRICTVGPQYKVVTDEAADERPFACFTPDPEPHTLIGQSLEDRTGDMQLVKSSVMRSVLDSLALCVWPRMAILEGQVSVKDVLNTALGAPIRERVSGAVRPIVLPFSGREAFPVLEYFDDIIERRTGQNKGAIGLDADALQSSTKAAVGAAVTASQAQSELLCRLFAEQALKPLFRGILRLLVQYQPKAELARIRGKWVPVDPRVWDADMDMTVTVALGTGALEDRMQKLGVVLQKQETILQTLGPSNPLVSLAQYSDALQTATVLLGFPDPSRFFGKVDPNWQPPAPPAPQQSPEQVLAQAQLAIEQMKSERELAIKQSQLQLAQQTALWLHEREVAKNAADIELRRYELELKYSQQLDQSQFAQDQAQMESLVDQRIAMHTAQAQQAQQAAQQQHDAEQQAAQQQHEQQMQAAQQQHDAALQAAQQQHEQQMQPPAADDAGGAE